VAVSRDPAFRTVRMRESYDLDAVDDFVDRVIDALEGRPGGRSLTPEKIEAQEFKVVRLREGYSMDDVDDWLDAAAAELRRMRAAGGGRRPQPQPRQEAPRAEPSYEQVGAPANTYAGPPAGPAAVPPVAPPPPVAYPLPEPSQQPYHPDYVAPHHTDAGHRTAEPGYDTGYQDPVRDTGYHDTGYQDPVRDTGYHDTGYQDAVRDTGFQDTGYDTGYPQPGVDTAFHQLDPALQQLDPNFPQVGTGHDEARPATQVSTPTTGLHHVEVWVRDLEVGVQSFGWLFERLGWTLFQAWDNGRSWQAPGNGPYVVVERSPDLTWTQYDRKAPGLNHLALAVPERWMVDRIVSEAPTYGWRLLFADRHPFAGGNQHYAAYLENEEGFEVEVVAP
jgi:DivIVA domain-containing protein